MILHWRFDTPDLFHLLSQDSHSSSWKASSFKVWSIDRDGRHETCTSTALEIFGREASLVIFRYGRVEYFMVTKFWNGIVLEYPSDHRFSLVRGCWRKWKKFPSAVYYSGISMLKIYSTCAIDFSSTVCVGRFHGCFFSLPSPFLQPSRQKNAVM